MNHQTLKVTLTLEEAAHWGPGDSGLGDLGLGDSGGRRLGGPGDWGEGDSGAGRLGRLAPKWVPPWSKEQAVARAKLPGTQGSPA